ncbi:MAG TPA: AbrB/MazE/SpoVT family DNA-binding domain-containing protein [Trueperaceae bacterium]
MQATITSKGRVTIPKAVRQKLGLQAGDRIEFLVQMDGTVQVVPATIPLASLRGVLPKPPRA